MFKNLEFISLEAEALENNFGKFLLQPLNKGMGITVGNMFRRLLLTQISSTNITAVRIPGINNEFSTIPGVREDVLEIVLNLRQIILKGFIKDKTYARLKIQGPAIITANSIKWDSIPNVSLVNSTQYIATIFDTSIVEMEFRIESKKDYTIRKNKFSLTSSDFIKVEQISSPVQRVLFEVDDTLSSQNQEKLLLKVWTNGSITPLEAIINVSEIIQQFFGLINKKNLKIITKDNVNS
jgi:DNA-directed RNA polymerase subunit alpha